MAFAVERVIVIDEGLYQGTGLVHRWLARIGVSMYHNTLQAAPERSGELKAGIHLSQAREGRRIISVAVESTAPHTMYVIGGTAGNGLGFIYTTRGRANPGTVGRMLNGVFVKDAPRGLWLVLSDARGGRHLRVHGQRKNNFLAKGYDATARVHQSLRSFPHF